MTFVKATPYARKIAKQYHIDLSAVQPTGPDGAVIEKDVERAHEGRQRTREVPVTPLALRIAASMHIDLDRVKGTGLGGKISKKDVIASSGRMEDGLPGERREVLDGMRRAVAEKMTLSYAVPSVTVTTKVDVTELLELRAQHNAHHKHQYTINDLVLAAVAKALAKDKRMLCSFDTDSIIYKEEVNIGVAVSLEEGLLVPVIRNADQMSMDEISKTAHDLAKRVRQHRITPDECTGSSFTVTNMGMFGVEAFTPLINLPDAAILGVCAVSDGCIVKDGQPQVRQVMRICLTFDHRAMDGAQAAKFNLSVREYLENPGSLIKK